MKKTKTQRGITLIALIITIVILLILAVVTINSITGDGIITKAQKAKTDYSSAQVEEEIRLSLYNLKMEEASKNTQMTQEEKIAYLQAEMTNSDSSATLEKIEEKYIATYKGYEIQLDEKLNIINIDTNLEINKPLRVAIKETKNDEGYPDIYITYEVENAIGDIKSSVYVRNTGETEYKEIESSDSKTTIENGIIEKIAHIYYRGTNNDTYCDIKIEVEDSNGSKVSAEVTNQYFYTCFVAGTKILTENGLRNIENINVGEKVYSVDIQTNKKELQEVIAVHNSKTNRIYELNIGDETVRTTEKHSFYIKDKGWVSACELKEGDIVISENNQHSEVIGIKINDLKESINVYNLTVEKNHNYLITESEFLVHNACGK